MEGWKYKQEVENLETRYIIENKKYDIDWELVNAQKHK